MIKLKSIFLYLIFLYPVLIHASSPDAELIEKISHYSIKNGKLTSEEKCTIQINNRAGEKYAEIKILYSKGNELKNFDVQLTDQYGIQIRKIKKSEIIDISAFASFSFYEDEFYRTVNLKHNQYPYRITYSYETEVNEFIRIANWFPIMDTDIPTRHAQLVFSCPSDYKFNFKNTNIENPKKEESDGQIIYTWNAKYDQLIRHEIYAPPLEENLPNVQIIPEKFIYGIPGSFKNWTSFGNWIYELNEGLDVLPIDEERKIDAVIRGCTTQIERVKKLYQYLQENTRYVNIKLGIGGLKPHPASYVARNKYGDCKALTNYLKSLLKYAGISSYYSLINAGENQERIDVDFPSQQFNHVILYVPTDGEDIWLECTQKTYPFNYLGSFTQNRKAFVIDKGNSRFMETPALNESASYDSHYCEINVQNDLTLTTDSHFLFKASDNFELYNYLFLSAAQKDTDKFIDRLPGYANSHIIDSKIEKNENFPDEIMIDLNAEIKLPLKKYGREVLFDLPELHIPDFELPNQRTQSVRIDYPILKMDTLTLSLPSNLSPLEVPENIIQETKFGKYSLTRITCPRENCLQFSREFHLASGSYDLSDYQAFYSFLSDAKKVENRKIIFQLNN